MQTRNCYTWTYDVIDPFISTPFKCCTEVFRDYKAAFYITMFVCCYVVLVAAQNDSASGWEPKVVEFFKDKLKEKDIHALVK